MYSKQKNILLKHIYSHKTIFSTGDLVIRYEKP